MNPRRVSLLSTLLVALLLVMAMGSATPGTALAQAEELFLSEYIEGSSLNKAIEIYNGTESAVDLAAGGYTLELYSNGAASASQSVALSGTIAVGDVYVLAHGSADAAILAQADLISNAVINFNGDDAIVLRKAGAVIDAFGQIGVDPGTEWPGGGVDDTLRRKSHICAGDTNATDAFDASVEWDTFPINTFDGLGAHTADCDGGSEPADPLLNEFVFNHVGTDTHEYVEVVGDPNTDYSAFTIVGIEGDGTGSGVVDNVITVGTTNAEGYWVTDFFGDAFENGTITVLLVEGFSGATGVDLDADNNGVLDTTPWERIVDDFAVSDGGASDVTYSAVVLAPGFGGNPFTPGGASRIPDASDTDSANDWMVNDFDGEGLPGFSGTPVSGEAFNTPGATNVAVPTGPATGVIINELDSDTPGTDELEFVELYDGGAGNTALDGLVVVFYNGSSDVSYAAFDLDGFTTDANGYFLMGNAGVTPAPALTFAGNFLQNGQDAVALYVGDASDFPNGTAVTTEGLIDAVVYDTDDADDAGLLVLLNAGQPQVNEAGGGDQVGHSIQRCPNGSGGARNTETYTQAAPTPGADNDCGNGGSGEIGACFDATTHFIHEVQGSGLASALAGQTVVLEAVVVGDFQNNAEPDNGDLNGFYMQEEDADADADPLTSEGIFVHTPGTPTDVSNGDVVRVLGAVSEANGLTQLTNTQVLVCAAGASVTPAVVTLPVDEVNDLEAFEGMSVVFQQDLYISEYFNYDRFGEIVLTSERQFQPTAVYEPGSAEAADLASFNARSRITLDDGRGTQNPDPAIHPNGAEFNLDNLFRGGDTLRNVTGVMDYAFGLYRIQPTAGAEHIEANPRTAAPEDVGGNLQVASFNVLNYFTTLTSAGNVCGPPGNLQECRGADTPEELARQRAKIVAAIAAMDAEVVGLIEIQNDEGQSTADLVNGLNDLLGAGTYAYIDTGYVGTDAIKQAFIYQPAEATPVGDYAVLDTPEFIDPAGSGSPRNRPALAQTFMHNDSGELFTVVVNHFKSKGSACGPGDDDPQQGNCNLTRTLSAQVLADWLATDPTGSGDPDFLIIGDLNAYDKEDPIDVLLANGYTDLVFKFEGEYAYSYVFEAQLGYLDHALANESLLEQVTGTTVWHINADEPDLIDYDMSFKQDAQDAIWAPDPYRSSDHDPVIVGLQFEQANNAPVCAGAVPSRATIWPPNGNFVNITILGVTDPDGDSVSITIDAIFQDEAVNAPGSGNTGPDGAGVGTSTAQVRAERVGSGNGRVYHIYFTATDSAGASCSGVVQVGVPQAPPKAIIDGGPLYDSTVKP